MTVDFTVPGKPQGKARPRVTAHGTYTPAATRDYEKLVRLAYLQARQRGLPRLLQGAIEARITAYFPAPKSAGKKQRALMLSGKMPYTKKSDCDNIAKIILDAINGVAYKDDSQISSLRVEKLYGEPPCVVVTLVEIERLRRSL
ncbi:MAG: RusA family crossover junction endodeoxyribonuclease [Oscillospiraceae bacterium]|jgi:Holliday junction resolvase RusA-like endonuclease|nr:RusA family crossover junction endodeoxyribonuclease [Oscillospiraceae bacterium]